MNGRSFRERGSRRENVKDLVSDLELLFLQAGVVDDEAQRTAFIGCFFEFPQALHRLSRTSSYSGAVAEALAWEGDMVRKEGEQLTSHLWPQQVDPLQGHRRQRTVRDPSYASASLERPGNPTPGGGTTALGLSPVHTRFAADPPAETAPISPVSPHDDVTFRDDDLLDPTDALVDDDRAQSGYTATRRSLSHTRQGAYPARSVETLHAYPASSTRAQPDHIRANDDYEHPRARSSLAAYPSPEALPIPLRRNHLLPPPLAPRTMTGYKTSCAGSRQRAGFPSFSTPPTAAAPLPDGAVEIDLQRPSTSTFSSSSPQMRTRTPPFVAEATSYRSSSSLLQSYHIDNDEGGDSVYDRFPYPTHPSPLQPSFSAYTTRPISANGAAMLANRFRTGTGRGKPPLSPSFGARRELEKEREGEVGKKKGGLKGRGTLLGALFEKAGVGMHGRRKSVQLPPSAAEKREEERRWVGGSSTLGRGEGMRSAQELPLSPGVDLGEGEFEIGRPPKRRAGLAGLGLPP
ncbi:hypothetical protein JCM11641_007820 [Rhodosporidiobolus odoratus]